MNNQAMNYLAVAPAWNRPSTTSASGNSNSAPLTPGNYLGGGAILLVLALMLGVGCNAAGLLPRRSRQAKLNARDRHLVH